jgi:hypothetical protein
MIRGLHFSASPPWLLTLRVPLFHHRRQKNCHEFRSTQPWTISIVVERYNSLQTEPPPLAPCSLNLEACVPREYNNICRCWYCFRGESSCPLSSPPSELLLLCGPKNVFLWQRKIDSGCGLRGASVSPPFQATRRQEGTACDKACQGKPVCWSNVLELRGIVCTCVCGNLESVQEGSPFRRLYSFDKGLLLSQ